MGKSLHITKLVRVRGPNHYIVLMGTKQPCNICYWYFLLRSCLSEVFDDPFHQTKKGETNKTVIVNFYQPFAAWSTSGLSLSFVVSWDICVLKTSLTSGTTSISDTSLTSNHPYLLGPPPPLGPTPTSGAIPHLWDHFALFWPKPI